MDWFASSSARRRCYSEQVLTSDSTSQNDQLPRYVETGGLRWGQPYFGMAKNATYPFATIAVSDDHLRLSVNAWGIWKDSFEFERREVVKIRRKRGLLSTGVVVEHNKPEYPPLIVFWTLDYENLCQELRRRGYDVIDA
jgi:hypothetical protein